MPPCGSDCISRCCAAGANGKATEVREGSAFSRHTTSRRKERRISNRRWYYGFISTAPSAAAVAKAPPDDHTLLVQAFTLVTGPLLVTNVPYDAVKDFIAISEIGSVPLIMTVHQSLEAKSLEQFI